MSIRYGVSPIAWSNDDMPELGGDTPLETVFGDIRDLGFEGVELGGRFPRDPAVLKPLLSRYALQLVGGWYSASLLTRSAREEITAMQPYLALLEAMGSDVCVFAETSNAIHGQRDCSLRDSPQMANDGWKAFGERMTTVAEHVRGRGMRFAYHHHLGTVVERDADLRAFLAYTGEAVGLTLDTGHATLGGIDPLAIIADYPCRVAHVHCKDVRRKVFHKVIDDGASFLDGVLAGMFTVPGDGDLDYAALMHALAGMQYSGWIILEAEQDPARADPRAYAELGLRTLRDSATAARLR